VDVKRDDTQKWMIIPEALSGKMFTGLE